MAVGIILIVLNAIGACIGGLAVMAGGFIAGAGSSLQGMKDASGKEVSQQTLQTAGGIALIFGIVWLIACALSIIGAVGILKGLRWGFMLVFVMGIIGVLGSFVPFNPISLVFGLAGAIYCGLRLFGNVGPKPA
jgi:hypothetical protein